MTPQDKKKEIVEKFERNWNECNCNDGWDVGKCHPQSGSGQISAKTEIKTFLSQALDEYAEVVCGGAFNRAIKELRDRADILVCNEIPAYCADVGCHIETEREALRHSADYLAALTPKNKEE